MSSVISIPVGVFVPSSLWQLSPQAVSDCESIVQVVGSSSRLTPFPCNCLNLAWNLAIIVIVKLVKLTVVFTLVIPKKNLALLPTGRNWDNCKNEKSAFCFAHWYFNSF